MWFLWLHLQNNSIETRHLCGHFTDFKPSSEAFRSLPEGIEPLKWSLVIIISLLPENAPTLPIVRCNPYHVTTASPLDAAITGISIYCASLYDTSQGVFFTNEGLWQFLCCQMIAVLSNQVLLN